MATPWWERSLDYLVLAEAVFFTVAGVNHIAAMWILRANFFIAVRSPLLASTSGLFASMHSCVVIFDTIQGWTDVDKPGIITIYGVPMILTLFVGAYVMRGLRLLVIYDPKLRRRCGRHMKERQIFRALVGPTFLIEVAAWSATLWFGLERVATIISDVGIPVEILTILAAAILLSGKLKKTDDLFNMSTEILVVGSIALMSIVLYVPIIAAPMPPVVLKYLFALWTMISLQIPVFITNITPVRKVLGQSDGWEGRVSILPYAPWSRLPNAQLAAVGAESARTMSSGTRSGSSGNPLGNIMAFTPLREAFQEFCRKALCSESLQFLVVVSEFKEIIHATNGSQEREYDTFVSIVHEFIVADSPSEVNIGGEVKAHILSFADQDTYAQLGTDERENILAPAEKEIVKVLTENLLNRFKASEHYRQITEELLSINHHQPTRSERAGSAGSNVTTV